MVGIVDEERGHGRRGAPAWGSRRHGAVIRRGAVLRRGAVHGHRRRRRGAQGWERQRGAQWTGAQGTVVPVGVGWCSGGTGGGVGVGLK